jgi:hypothetical protein
VRRSGKGKRSFIVVLGVTLLASGLTSCGGSAADEMAAQVGTKKIARSEVQHWMSVIAGEVSTAAGQPEPSVPKPPNYSACIVYKKKYPITPSTSEPKSASEVKHECRLEFEKEKLKALYFLIPLVWVKGEAAELGVNLTGKALEQELAAAKRQFPSEAVARKFLVGTRGTAKDLSARLTQLVLVARVQRILERQAAQRHLTRAQRQQALDQFSERFGRTWRARTSCRPGYVMPICRQYRAQKAPSPVTPPTLPLTKLTAE